jgi:acetyltransferase
MSIRNLDSLFKPRSVAMIGASRDPGSIGALVARNLFNAGFDGPIMPVNPHHQAIEGVLAYPDPASLPLTPDLAVITTPADAVAPTVVALAARGTRAAVVISAGFGEGGDDRGRDRRRALLEAARPHLVRLCGPNCIGIMVPGVGLNASFAHLAPRSGQLAFVAQSGAMVTSVLDWAAARGIGFSHLVSLGDMLDVDFGDMLDYLAGEPEVRGILLYIEAVTQARKFMSAARAAARLKPVIVIKAGRHPAAAAAVASHTGAMAGADAVYDAAFRRAGMLRVYDIGALFGAVETLAMGLPVAGDRLAVVTNGGGLGIMAVDALIDHGGRLAALSAATAAALDKLLPPICARSNPVDIAGDATAERYRRALEVVLADPGADAVLVLNCPTAVASGTDAARAVVEAVEGRRACVLTCWLGEDAARLARKVFADHRIPSYFTPERAVRAFMDLVHYRRNQDALTQTPPSVPEEFAPDSDRARAVVTAALAEGREWLSEAEAMAMLAAYRIPVVATEIVADPAGAAAAAAAVGKPVVLKIVSPDIVHKSDVGGVVLDLRTPAAVEMAARTMLEQIAARRPEARVDGLAVQEMIARPDAIELIAGVSEDPQFGPVILFGHGGIAVEIVADRALALPPLNLHLAREAMARTRVFALLQGFRGRPPAAIDAIALTLVKLSQLVVDLAELAELDINPLLADADGVLALDARIRVRPNDAPAAKRLAISPYPKELETAMQLPDGRRFVVRPVRPEDEPGFQDLFKGLTASDVRMRFFAPKRVLTHAAAARMTQIDYDREMALVVADAGAPGRSEIFGVVHLTADPDDERAEFAIMLQSDMSGLGLGPMLMRRIIDYGRARGLKEIVGDVLRENRPMLKVCRALGFTQTPNADDPSVVVVTLRLR